MPLLRWRRTMLETMEKKASPQRRNVAQYLLPQFSIWPIWRPSFLIASGSFWRRKHLSSWTCARTLTRLTSELVFLISVFYLINFYILYFLSSFIPFKSGSLFISPNSDGHLCRLQVQGQRGTQSDFLPLFYYSKYYYYLY